MSDMIEVVIKIPQDEYDYIQLYGTIKPFSGNFIAKQIKNGTVLPKGHGKIVDTRLAYQNTMQYSDKTRKMIMKVIDASVILEANKEEA